MPTIDSYSSSNGDGFAASYGSNRPIAQTFQLTTQATIDSATFYLAKFGSPTGSAFFYLYNVTGTLGSTSVPTGTEIATSTSISVSGLTGTYTAVTRTFTGVTLSPGLYAVAVQYTGGDSSNALLASLDTSSPTHAGNYAYKGGTTTWTASTNDVVFTVTGTLLFSLSPSDSTLAVSSTAPSPFEPYEIEADQVFYGGWGTSIFGLSFPGSALTTVQNTVELAVDDASHTVTSETPELAQETTLTVQNASHSLSSDVVAIGVRLSVNNTSHTVISTSPVLTFAELVFPSASNISLTSTSPVLTQNQLLAVDNSQHSISSESPTLTTKIYITVQGATHVITSETPNLTQVHFLVSEDSYHTVLSPELSLYRTYLNLVGDSAGIYEARITPTSELTAVATSPTDQYEARRTPTGVYTAVEDSESGSWTTT